MKTLMTAAMDMEIAPQTMNQRAYERLSELILMGHIRFGERLDERILAERMRISRTPIREAIGRLAIEGIVERRPYQGNFVRTFTVGQIRELYEVRKELEGLAARLAVERASEQEVDELAGIIERCHAAHEQGDRIAFEAMDQSFHEYIARISGNGTLIEFLEKLRLQVQLARHYSNEDPDAAQRTIEERNAVLKAFRDRDPDSAARAIRHHIDGAQKALVAQVISSS